MIFVIVSFYSSAETPDPKPFRASPKRKENIGIANPVNAAQMCPKTSIRRSPSVAKEIILLNVAACAASVD